MAHRNEIDSHLQALLDVGRFKDYGPNGLQVEGARPVRRLVSGVTASREPDATWMGERGYVHEVAERLFEGRFAGLEAYLCGPPAMIDACLTSLMRGRLFEAHIHTEQFLSAADGGAGKRRSALFRKF